jgi:pyruvate dehydrogenase kinase 2/3/4
MIRSSRGLASDADNKFGAYGKKNNSLLALKAMRLKLKAKTGAGAGGFEVSERRQVGDAEEMFSEKGAGQPWWRNVGMEEGM